MSQERIERTFSVGSPARLSLGNIGGSVNIQAGEEGVIQVVAVKHLDSGDVERTEVVVEQAADGSVKAETRYGGQNSWFTGGRPCEVDYTVRVPRQCSLAARVVSSDIQARGMTGDVRIEAVSGDTTLADLSGDLKLKTVSGNLTADRLSGSLHLETVSGEARLARCEFGMLDARTVSGNVLLETPLTTGAQPHRFKSVSGDVTLALPQAVRCTVEGSSLSGSLHTNLPARRSKLGGRHWRVEVGEANGSANPPVQILFESVSASMRLNVAGGGAGQSTPLNTWQEDWMHQPAPVTPPTPPTPATPPTPLAPPATPGPSRADVLDRVARGEMTVEQAIETLQGR